MQYRAKLNNDEIVNAIQWTGRNERDMFDFLTDYTKENDRVTVEEDTFRIDFVNGPCQVGNLIIKTSKGEKKADKGDYIIRNITGEFYPCNKDIFLETYEPA